MRSPIIHATALTILLGAVVALAPHALAEEPAATNLDPGPVAGGFDRIPVEDLTEPGTALVDLGEIVVTATRTRTREMDVPRAMDVIREARDPRAGRHDRRRRPGRPGRHLGREAHAHTSDPVIRGLGRVQPAGPGRREHPLHVLGRGRLRRGRHVREDQPRQRRAHRGGPRAVVGAVRLERAGRRPELHHAREPVRLHDVRYALGRTTFALAGSAP